MGVNNSVLSLVFDVHSVPAAPVFAESLLQRACAAAGKERCVPPDTGKCALP